MNIGVIDLIIIVGAVVIFLAPLLIGYFGFGSPNRHHRLLKTAIIGIAGLQLVVLIYFGWIFGTEKLRHVNHLKWIAPLIFVDLLMWVCLGIGFGAAALRYRIKTTIRQ
jgi:NADH:ubiquinone oxidoreductase subunit 6 (subunit J)